MPRSPRYNFPGAIHHVILRGNQGRPIFYSDYDRVKCCLLIQEVMERYGHRIHGFCLMSNHIHLAMQQGSAKLSTAMQNFTFRYAQRVNRFRDEIGHVFQGRFKSILVDKANYLAKLVRYIHLNPVRAGIVKRPEDYKWSGHNSYLGIDSVAWVERDYVLKMYSEDRDTAVKRYIDFVYAGIGNESEINFQTGMQSGIIGDDSFINMVLDEKKELGSKFDDSTITLTALLEHICIKYNVTEIEIASESKIRELTHVRAVISLLARDEGLSLIDIAKRLKRDPGGLSRLANKLHRASKDSSVVKQKLTSLRSELLSSMVKN